MWKWEDLGRGSRILIGRKKSGKAFQRGERSNIKGQDGWLLAGASAHGAEQACPPILPRNGRAWKESCLLDWKAFGWKQAGEPKPQGRFFLSLELLHLFTACSWYAGARGRCLAG